MKKRIVVFAIVVALVFLIPWFLMPSWTTVNSTQIDAPSERVWEILADFERYGTWNAYYREASGKLELGANVRIQAKLGEELVESDNLITVLEPGEKLCWKSKSWYDFLAAGTRCRQLEVESDSSTILHHSEILEGPLVWLVSRIYGEDITQGLKAHDQSLKRVAEKRIAEATEQ